MKYLDQLDLNDKTIFLRTEFNVALDSEFTIVDDSRIRVSLPTIEFLAGRGAKVVICAHLGRPWGKRDPAKSLQHVRGPLSALLGQEVGFAEDCIGPKRIEKQNRLSKGEVLLLENVRYHQEENDNDPAFAKALAEGIDIYVNDAFGTAHRAHASTAGIAKCIREKAPGLLVQKELGAINSFLEGAEQPSVAVIGGAKVAGKDGKIHAIRNLLGIVDVVCVVGKIAYYFLQAKGLPVGQTLTSDKRQFDAPGSDLAESLRDCEKVLAEAENLGKKILLPTDSLAHQGEGTGVITIDHDGGSVPEDAAACDIGPRTVSAIDALIAGAKTVVWNGPAGFFEDARFKEGSIAVAKAVAKTGARVLIGGGDTLAAAVGMTFDPERVHVSSGGGAMLAMLMGRELPAVKALHED